MKKILSLLVFSFLLSSTYAQKHGTVTGIDVLDAKANFGASYSPLSFINKEYADSLHSLAALLSGSYSNPSWITALAQSKIIWSGTSLQYVNGAGTNTTFPTNLSSFTNGPGYIASSSIAGATDATVTSPTSGQFLHYNGSKWVNYTLVAGDIPTLSYAASGITWATVMGNGATSTIAATAPGYIANAGNGIGYYSFDSSNVLRDAIGLNVNGTVFFARYSSAGSFIDEPVTISGTTGALNAVDGFNTTQIVTSGTSANGITMQNGGSSIYAEQVVTGGNLSIGATNPIIMTNVGGLQFSGYTTNGFAEFTGSNGTLASVASTGSGSVVLATSPTLVTPTIGVATATSINKVAITAPATSATLALANGSTLTTAGAFGITLTSTAATSVTLPTSGTLVNSIVTSLPDLTTAAGGPFGTDAFSSIAYAPLASPGLTGVPTAPTASTGTNTTQIASTAFVLAQIAASGSTITGITGGQGITSSVSSGVATISLTRLDTVENAGSSYTNSTTSGTATSLSFAGVSGKAYAVDAWLFVSSSSSSGIEIGWSVTGSVTEISTAYGTTSSYTAFTSGAVGSSIGVPAFCTWSGNGWIHIQGTVVCSSAATMTLEAAAGGASTTVEINAGYMQVRQI